MLWLTTRGAEGDIKVRTDGGDANWEWESKVVSTLPPYLE